MPKTVICKQLRQSLQDDDLTLVLMQLPEMPVQQAVVMKVTRPLPSLVEWDVTT